MTTPVTSSPRHQALPADNATTEAAPVQDTLAAENKSQEPQKLTLQDQFDNLTRRYYTTLRVTAGCGDRAQGYIDAEYAQLTQFANEHPEFKAKLPKKHIADDDGTGGMATGFATFAMDSRRRGEECCIQ